MVGGEIVLIVERGWKQKIKKSTYMRDFPINYLVYIYIYESVSKEINTFVSRKRKFDH